MTQKAVHRQLYLSKLLSGSIKNATVQTEHSQQDFVVHLTNKKSIRVYYSNAYKEIVISFNFGTKSFIFTKLMWFIFKKHLPFIDTLIKKE